MTMHDGDDAAAWAFDALPAQVAIVDAHGTLLAVNAAWRRFADEAGGARSGPGANFFQVCAAAAGPDAIAATQASAGLQSVLAGRLDQFEMDVACDTPQGRMWFVARVVPLQQDPRTGDRLPGALLSYTEITWRRHAETQALHEATHDPLTGLPNRLVVEDRLGQAIAESVRSGRPVTVMLCDIDGLGRVNDEHGRGAGDDVLVEVARRLRAGVRPQDVVGRLIGDEFAVLCVTPASRERAGAIAQRLVDAAAQPVATRDASLRVSLSVGVHTAGPDDDPEAALRWAHQAMLRAKRVGGGRSRWSLDKPHEPESRSS